MEVRKDGYKRLILLCRSERMCVGFVLIIVVLTTEKIFIVEHYFRSYAAGHQNGPSLRHVREHYEEHLTRRHKVTKQSYLSSRSSFVRDQSYVTEGRLIGHPRTVTTNEKHERLLQQVLQSPKRSLRRTSLKLGVSDRSVRRMFKELGGFAYRIQVAQHVTETDERARLQYCSLVLSMTCADPDFFSNIRFSDESHIHLNSYINRQRTRFLGFGRPDVVVKKPLHSARVTIWCAVSGRGILGPYFVEDDAQNPLTVN